MTEAITSGGLLKLMVEMAYLSNACKKAGLFDLIE